MRFRAFFALWFLLFTGCASPGYVSKTYKALPQMAHEAGDGRRPAVTIVADYPVIYDSFSDYLLLAESRKAVAAIQEAARTALVENNFEVKVFPLPYIGGFCYPGSMKTKDALGRTGTHPMPVMFCEDPVKQWSPFIYCEKTVINTAPQLLKSKEPVFVFNSEPLSVLRRKLDTKYALFIVGTGVDVGFMKAFCVSLGSAIVTLGMGFVVQSSASNSYAALIDLETGEYLWGNAFQEHADVIDTGYYAKDWRKRMFAELAPKAKQDAKQQ